MKEKTAIYITISMVIINFLLINNIWLYVQNRKLNVKNSKLIERNSVLELVYKRERFIYPFQANPLPEPTPPPLPPLNISSYADRTPEPLFPFYVNEQHCLDFINESLEKTYLRDHDHEEAVKYAFFNYMLYINAELDVYKAIWLEKRFMMRDEPIDIIAQVYASIHDEVRSRTEHEVMRWYEVYKSQGKLPL